MSDSHWGLTIRWALQPTQRVHVSPSSGYLYGSAPWALCLSAFWLPLTAVKQELAPQAEIYVVYVALESSYA